MDTSTSNFSLFRNAKLNIVEDTGTDNGDNDGDSSDMEDIYEANEDDTHDAREVILTNRPFVGPLDTPNMLIGNYLMTDCNY